MKPAATKADSAASDGRFAVSLLLLVAIFAVFFQVRAFEFITYDDPLYVYENSQVMGGLDADSVSWAFTAFHAANWHPLTWLSHIVDWEMFGSDAGGHHLMSVVIHAAAAVVLFLALRRLTGRHWQSALVAVLFAVHPLRAESVAWVAERKDVLSGLLWMMVLYAWTRYVEKPGVGRYVVVAVLFALGLASKPMVVTLPFVLLLLDVWPLRRLRIGFRADSSEESGSMTATNRQAMRLVLEKLPLMVLAVGSAAATVFAQRGAMEQLGSLSLSVRFANAVVAWVGYVVKTVAPVRLAVFYPHPEDSLPLWQPVVAVVILVAVTVAVIVGIRRRPHLAVGWFWYVGTTVPVIGLVQVGSQAMADRYTYLPQIGLWLMLAWSLAELWNRRAALRSMIAAAVGVLIGLSMVMTWRQVGFWKDSTTLYRHTLESTADNWVAHAHLAGILVEQGRYAETVEHCEASLAIRPESPVARAYYGRALLGVGNPREAAQQLERALVSEPESPTILFYLGRALAELGDHDGARTRYRQALEGDPGNIEARNNLGVSLLSVGDIDGAATVLCAAEAASSDDMLLHFNCGLALAGLDKYDSAAERFRRAAGLNPRNVGVWRALASALERAGRTAEAVAAYRRVQQLAPNDQTVRQALERLGQPTP